MVSTSRILFVSLSPFFSIYSSSIRNRMLVEGMLKTGCSVTVLSMESGMVPKHKGENIEPFVSSGCLTILDVGEEGSSNKGMALDKLRSYKRGLLASIFKKISPVEASYFISRSFKIEKLGSDIEFDVVVSSSDPKASHFFAQRLMEQGVSARRWIQYWGDPYLLDITLESLIPRGLIRLIERSLLKRADKVVYTSPLLSKAQKEVYPSCANKIFYVPTAAERKGSWSFPARPPFVVGYHGSYYDGFRNIEPLVRACERLAPDVRLEIVGAGDAATFVSSSVKFYAPTADISAFERESHALALVCNKTGFQLPGKFYHVAGTNRPAIAIVDGEHADAWEGYLADFDRFLICRNNVDSIASALKGIMSEDDLMCDFPEALDSRSIADQFLSFAADGDRGTTLG